MLVRLVVTLAQSGKRLDPGPDVILLQEANLRSVDTICDELVHDPGVLGPGQAGSGWANTVRTSVDISAA
jgi:hypothetical protein